MKKICSKCKEEKDLDFFHKNKNSKHGVHHYCKSCNSIHRKNSYNYNTVKKRQLKSKYNLTIEELNILYLSQDKKCRICKNYFYSVSKHKGLYVDHCHVTNKVRGLLCSKCNTFIGLAKDDVLILKSAIDYLLSL
jgi:hypothetical protein